MRVLAIDIGNTRVSTALYENDSRTRRTDLAVNALSPEIWQKQDAECCAISCVSAAHRDVVSQIVAKGAFELTAATAAIKLHYDFPERLGTDRISNVIAIHDVSPDGAIVADLGTATHFDICRSDGSFMGGPILPGLETMAQMLATRIPHLPTVTTASSPAVVTNTEDGIRAGCLYATAGAIERITAEIRQTTGPLPLYLTGGNADRIAPLVAHSQIIPDLTLRGIYLFALRMKQV